MMSRISKSGVEDYVRVPLPGDLDSNVESESELVGYSAPSISDGSAESKTSLTLWNFSFYQQYFDVDTTQVLRRLMASIFPNPRVNFVQYILRPRPDLYGPFWIVTTLILASAIGGNVSSYFQSFGRLTSWHYDFQKVTLASTIIYLYWWLVPLGITGLTYIRSKKANPDLQADQDLLIDASESRDNVQPSGRYGSFKLTELLSIYGYSLSIFVPVSLLWTFPSSIFRWLLLIIAAAVSCTFLALTLLPGFRRQHQKLAGPLLIGILILQCVFSLGLMFTFFHGAPTGPPGTEPFPPQPANLPPEIKHVKRSVSDSMDQLAVISAVSKTVPSSGLTGVLHP
ncbi:unnamed protein product [Dicrocoelium dendriticum]|nr:unnamed protein product [Dicrocoelium dendriticum]CAH8490102.1 unnamed protein product [Dicrocoelium dendriticum]